MELPVHYFTDPRFLLECVIRQRCFMERDRRSVSSMSATFNVVSVTETWSNEPWQMGQGQRPRSPVVAHFLVVVASIAYVMAPPLIGGDVGKHTEAISKFVRTSLQSLSADRRRGDSSEYEANEDFHLGGVVCR